MNSILPGMPPAAWGALLLVLGLLFHWLRFLVRAGTVMAFIGVCLLGGGMLSSLLIRGARAVSSLTDSLTGKMFGVAIPGLLVIILAIFFIIDLRGIGRGKHGKRTLFIGIALASCLLAGLSSFPALNQAPHNLQTTVSTVTTGR